ncbi:MAG: DUF342 domain-containing protein, partial [Chitinivibrionales bacterium]
MIDVVVEVSYDKMEAFVSVQGTGEVSNDDIARALLSNDVEFGYIEDNIKYIAAHNIKDKKVKVAEGRPVKQGRDGSAEIMIDISKVGKPRLLQNGRVDFKDINSIINVNKGDPLMRIHPAVYGKNGYNVLGEAIYPEKVEEASVEIGPGAVFSPDNENLVVAGLRGAVFLGQNNSVEVRSVKTVKGNVDYSTGNIKFNGELIINGRVLSGFTLDAEGDVVVKEGVENASVRSAQNIRIYKGAVGKKGDVIEAGGDISVKYTEGISMKAGSSIVIDKSAVHATLVAEYEISAEEIVGGMVTAGRVIRADTIGTEKEVKTLLDLQYSRRLEQDIKGLEDSVGVVEEERNTLADKMHTLVKNGMNRDGELLGSDEEYLEKLRKMYKDLLDREDTIISKLEKRRRDLREIGSTVTIYAGTVYPNTVIRTGGK